MQSKTKVEGTIDIRTANTDDLREAFDSLVETPRAPTKEELHLLSRDPKTVDVSSLDTAWEYTLSQVEVTPYEEIHTHNVTCIGLHELVADYINPNVAPTAEATHLAVGDSDLSTPASGDTTLNNEVYREAIGSHTDNGDTLQTSTFLGSADANGYTLKEVGIFTAATAGTLLNHSLIPAVTKDSSKTMTLEVNLTFSSA